MTFCKFDLRSQATSGREDMLEETGRRALIFILFAGALACSRDAAAEVVTFEARGTLTVVQNTIGAFPASLAPGDSFVLRYSFETDTPAFSDDGVQARYFQPVSNVNFQLGSTVFASGALQFPNDIYIANDQVRTPGTFTDVYALSAFSAGPPGTDIRYNVFFQLANIDGPASSNGVTDTRLNAVPPDLSGFLNKGFRVEAYDGSAPVLQFNTVFGEVTSLSAVPAVPLPAAFWLLLSAIGGLRVIRRVV